MRISFKAICLCLGLSGLLGACSPPSGGLPTLSSSSLATEQAYWNAVCVSSAGKPSIIQTLGVLQMNAGQAKAYNLASTLCAAPMPTDVATMAVDAVVVGLAIQQNFPNIKLKV
jgi:hypothetical protein